MQRLELSSVPIAGPNLIEASAGTGKTYTISGLVLRLVLEQGLGIDRILVVTYTKAATAELRERIRGRLSQARAVFAAGQSDDPLLRTLLAACPDRDLAQRRLTHAILGFERAPVLTIHGFCQRVLRDQAFETGMPFDSELEPDQSELLQELADDFWRLRVQDLPPGLAARMAAEDLRPEALLAEVQDGLGKPYLVPRGAEFPDGLAALEQDFETAHHTARDAWREQRQEISELLQQGKINRNKYRLTSVPGWFAAMDAFLRGPDGPWFDKFVKFTPAELAAAAPKGQAPLAHPFFDLCAELLVARQALEAAYDQARAALRLALLGYARRELPERRRRSRTLAYDDLLLNLHQALQGPGGPALATALRGQYQAALIDEFQDTDPIQYAIFQHIYDGSGLPLFFVGDPKQAIYGFRGADLFAYLRASREVAAGHTLEHNWRSDPGVIRAVNRLFGAGERPFLFADIGFRPALAAEREREPLVERGGRPEPFRVWLLASGAKPLSKEEARARLARATAAEIARLLRLAAEGGLTLGGRPLSGGDIAVLVATHREGRQVRQALMEQGVYSVQRSPDSVFHSAEAEQLELLLQALLEPGREARVRAALCGPLFGLDGQQIVDLNQDEQALEAHIEAFRDYRQRWLEQGFMRMLRHLMGQREAPRRLLALADGERRLTNLLHLAELLHQHDSTQSPGPEGLVKWLGQQRANAGAADEAQLRLESDENLVQIVTIHKSKGLEYPIVFCPFVWNGGLHQGKPGRPYQFHDPSQDWAALLELGSERMEQDRPLALGEELAERLRLLYVALTRAAHRCYLGWGRISGAEQSALGWLLHTPPQPDGPDPVARLAQGFRGLKDADLRRRLEQLAEQAKGQLCIEPLPAFGLGAGAGRSAAALGQARRLDRNLDSGVRVTSFTALARGLGDAGMAQLPDHDAGTAGPSQPVESVVPSGIFAFPRGARAGTCLHAVFEQLDFTMRDRVALERLVATTLARHGFGADWVETVADMVERVLATRLLDAGAASDEPLHLGRLAPAQCLVELEFHYALAPIRAAGLRRLLAASPWAAAPALQRALSRLAFADVRGHLKGFIDLVFEADGRYYLADYKSNWLGPQGVDYRPERLAEAVAEDAYFLQYLLYAIALHRYLGGRLPGYAYERHFGGVFYLFLRGMDPQPGPGRDTSNGVFFDRPPAELIRALDAYLGAGDVS